MTKIKFNSNHHNAGYKMIYGLTALVLFSQFSNVAGDEDVLHYFTIKGTDIIGRIAIVSFDAGPVPDLNSEYQIIKELKNKVAQFVENNQYNLTTTDVINNANVFSTNMCEKSISVSTGPAVIPSSSKYLFFHASTRNAITEGINSHLDSFCHENPGISIPWQTVGVVIGFIFAGCCACVLLTSFCAYLRESRTSYQQQNDVQLSSR